MKKATLKEIAQFEGQYIALTNQRSKVLAFGKTIKELEKNLKKLKIKDATIEYVVPINTALSPLCL